MDKITYPLGDFLGLNMTFSSNLPEPANVLYRIKRGLSGYVSYLAACEMNESFSEYVLYEPILRILTARAYSVECEVVCPGIAQPATGDRKKLDFVATGHDIRFALEVKWAKSQRLNVEKDYAKLAAFQNAGTKTGTRAFLCVFGRESNIRDIALKPNDLLEQGRVVIANLGVTKYGCRLFEVASPNHALQPTSRRRTKPTWRRKPNAARG